MNKDEKMYQKWIKHLADCDVCEKSRPNGAYVFMVRKNIMESSCEKAKAMYTYNP